MSQNRPCRAAASAALATDRLHFLRLGRKVEREHLVFRADPHGQRLSPGSGDFADQGPANR
jgi:hypothetical protein